MSCRILALKWPRGIPISPFIEIHVDCFGNTQDRYSVFHTISALRFCISFELINFISQKQAWSHSLAAGKKISSFVSLCYRPPTKLRQGIVFSCVYPSVCSWGVVSSNRTMGSLSARLCPYLCTGSSPAPSPNMVKFVHLYLYRDPPPRYVHYEACTVGKSAVDILLEWFLFCASSLEW